MLNFVFGRAGSGKSKYLKTIVSEKIKYGNNNIIFIVPEQSSFATEKEFIELLGNSNCNKVQVLSFSRLYDFVTKKLKLPIKNLTNDMTQNLIINAALENIKETLNLYKPNHKNDVAQIMLSSIQELKARKLSNESLAKVADNCENPTLAMKIKEIISISREYERLCFDKFSDMTDKMNSLGKIINENNIFKNYIVLFDEFDSFTDQQLFIIESIIKQAQNVYMAFCYEQHADEETAYSLFLPTQRTIRSIMSSAKSNNVPISESITLKNNYRAKNDELKLLENNIFRPAKTTSMPSVGNIKLYCASNIYDECENIARSICELVMEKGYRYKDFVILAGNIENYGHILKNIFKRYNIPLFLDTPENILNKSLISLITAAFSCITEGFHTNDVIQYMKSGLLSFSNEEIFLLENYALLWKIKSDSWGSEFCAHPKGYNENWSDDDIAMLGQTNQIRAQLITPLINLKKSISGGKTATQISEAIYRFLIQIQADTNLKKLYIKLRNCGNIQQAEKEAKVWDIVIELLSLTAQILGSKKISPKDYLRILTSGISAASCPSIPQSQDTVMAATIKRARLSNPKITFILGAAEGQFPANPEVSPIFNKREIRQMENVGVPVSENMENLLLRERFLAYTSICSPSEKLYISWPHVNCESESNNPSEIINEIRDIFPNIKIDNHRYRDIKHSVWSEKSAFDIYCAHHKRNLSVFNTLGHYFSNALNYADKYKILNRFLDPNSLTFRNTETLKNLFGDVIKLSASQIENYYRCSFGYLCKYGLNLKSIKPAKFSSLEYGNLMHKLFEKLFKKYPKNKILSVSSYQLEKDINEIIDDYIDSTIGKDAPGNPRIKYIVDKSKKTVLLIIKRLIKEFSQSKFVISDCELEISQKSKIKPIQFSLSTGQKIEIEGKIDRVDTMNESDQTYVRVIDYKTGSTTFELSNIVYGLNMQMLIYLMTIGRSGKYKNSIPAGVLYFKAHQPVIDARTNESHEITDSKIDKELCMSGIVLEDEKIIRAMDSNADGEFIPVKINGGKIKACKSAITPEELESIFSYIEILIKQMGNNLLGGKTPSNPIAESSVPACDFCDYLQICHYKKDKFQKISNISAKEKIFEKMNLKKGEILGEKMD